MIIIVTMGIIVVEVFLLGAMRSVMGSVGRGAPGSPILRQSEVYL